MAKPQLIVPSKSPEALAEAWLSVLSIPFEKRIELGLDLRKRVLEHFHIANIAQQYDDWHLSLLYPN